MSKFIDIATAQGRNQIEVIDSKGSIGDVFFYNKKDTDGNLILGFKAQSGKVVMFSVANGIESSPLETFDYTTITQPASSDLSDLIQILNGFLYT